jgi:bifunctional enzyme CysN/CysC
MKWYQGPTVLQALDQFNVTDLPLNQPLRMPIQDVYRFDDRRILAGRIESGSIKVGDRLVFAPSKKTSTVKTIERWGAPVQTSASAGESIGITLTEQIFVERGAVAALESHPPYELSRFKARLFWLGRQPFRPGRSYKIKLATQEAECQIESIDNVIDASTLGSVNRQGEDLFVGRHEVGEVTLRTKKPLAFDAHDEIVSTGRFVIVDGFEVSGGGIVVNDNYPRRTPDSQQKSDDIFWSHGKVTYEQRSIRNGHGGKVIWLTGLSGSGKSTIAGELERELFNQGKQTYILDGDNIRHGLCKDLGFSPEDRAENIRRVGEMAKVLADAGIICITAFISPYRKDRETIRTILKAGEFVEVYVNAPLEICEQRDPKGLYAKARAKEIPEFTGISAPYEAPVKPDVELRTDQLSVTESVSKILEYLHLQDDAAALI